MKTHKVTNPKIVTAWKSGLALTVIFAAFAGFTSVSRAQLGPEIMLNGNMESVTLGVPDWWDIGSGTKSASTNVPTGGGTYSLYMQSVGTGINQDIGQNQTAPTYIPLSSGNTYRMSFDYMSPLNSDGYMVFFADNGDAPSAITDFISTKMGSAPSSTWKSGTFDFSVGGTTTTEMYFRFYPFGGSGTNSELYVDNVSVKQVIPEPGSVALLAVAGGLCLLLSRKRRVVS